MTTKENLQNFINFCKEYITGQERKEAQIFLDRFFQAFGYDGALEAGAKYEEAIKKGSLKKNTGFADLVWKPKVLIEMKKRGEDLNKHYAQAFEYWSRLVPNRPRYVILCNFDEFWIFDFDLQLDEPVDIVALSDLGKRYSAFNFMARGESKPIFNNNQVEVTEKAGRRLGELFQILQQRLISPSPLENKPPKSPLKRETFNSMTPTLPREAGGVLKIQRFILQCVLAMFAEDRGLLPESLFIRCVEECIAGASSYDVLGGLFREMNSHGITPTGKYQGVEYFNGGLFATVETIELTKPELEILATVARQDWSKVRPAIFGNIFEGTVNAKERHSYGMHYTSEADIMKIVRPTITKYWEDLIDSANTVKELTNLQVQLQDYKVLDPACGSGNFLYVAYQELKRIEQVLLDKIASKNKGQNLQRNLSFVTPNQFFGMDINPFAVELAKVTLMIARKVAIDKFNLIEPALPLDSLDHNIICTDALFSDWIKADAIIGNPPFLGGKKLRQELGDDYAEKIYQQFKEVKGQPDFCIFWFRKTHDNLTENARAGLVGSNSISQNVSRQASLDYIVKNDGFIHDAVSTQVWSGEAAVHVSIVNWAKEKSNQLFLDNKPVYQISTSLKNEISVTSAKKLQANKNLSFESCGLRGKGFIISEEEAKEWIKKDSKNQEVLKPMIDGRGLIYPFEKLDWVIDFNDMSIEEASNYYLPFERVREKVKPERDKQRRESRKKYWWRFGESCPAMRRALKGLKCYFAIPKVVKYVLFTPVDISILPCEANMVIASDDFYFLGILTSKIHRIWVKAQSSTLGETLRYTNTTCFETFPFPQLKNAFFPRYLDSLNNSDDMKMVGIAHSTKEQKIVQQIRDKMIELNDYRNVQSTSKQWGITKLYNEYFHEPSIKLYQLHQQLDQLVMKAYNFDENEDLLTQILALNLTISENKM
ncbi:DNA methyltransferase [Geminocystis sp. GBBB08]|uniref:DNA methyltransferase n=1 Tax=Geminocystis sp. GBBB08 TaxID=2604140 RepID=UPI0027E32D7C|nr:DNA methyltransferase [Geminocystis sp. GBBB08]MBL1210905.1 class I SAM-dependent DNA methyltransferase [Geminocystis sp. GBBB08]